ncbi:MAG: universal stress protein [Myxococcales bacterium]|nr:universal stress protein [Myxococcales bacterium]
MVRFKKILVPVDFSAGSREALDYALYLAGCCQGEVVVLHAWELPDFTSFGRVALAVRDESGHGLEEVMPREAERAMKEFMEPYRNRGAAARVRVEQGNPPKTIVRIAENEGFDLIVMGTEGLAHVPGFLIGSVTEKVVRSAPCPVLAVPVMNR